MKSPLFGLLWSFLLHSGSATIRSMRVLLSLRQLTREPVFAAFCARALGPHKGRQMAFGLTGVVVLSRSLDFTER